MPPPQPSPRTTPHRSLPDGDVVAPDLFGGASAPPPAALGGAPGPAPDLFGTVPGGAPDPWAAPASPDVDADLPVIVGPPDHVHLPVPGRPGSAPAASSSSLAVATRSVPGEAPVGGPARSEPGSSVLGCGVGRADRMLQALDPEQREVAAAVSGPVCVLAGAGTGKTRAITHRIAYGVHAGVYVPQRVLAVTFTARAAGQMRTRLRDLGVAGVQARTFHAAALRQLTYFWPQVIGGAAPSLVEHKAGLVADAAARLRLSVDRPAVRDLAAEIEWAKVSLLTSGAYAAAAVRVGRGEPAGFDPATVSRLMEVYESVKTERNVIDFEDVLLLMVAVLEDHPRVAEEVRRQYRHFVVDEYQDVSALQQRLLDLWLGDREDLCVVGDPHQTIYSFTGASPAHLLGFPERFPHARVVRLVRDYRSTPQVVALANALVGRGRRGGSVGLPGTIPPGSGGSGPPDSGSPGSAPGSGTSRSGSPLLLQAQRPDGPAPELHAEEDDVAEAAATAVRIGGLIERGVRPSEIAVLFRTNAQSQPLESALGDAGIPYVLRGGERFFSRPEVRSAIMLLRGAARAPQEGRTLVRQVTDVLEATGWNPVAPSSGGAVRERWESLRALVTLAEDLAEVRPETTLSDLVSELDERASASHAPTVDGVTLASLHAAKGLEWDAVFLVGLSEGLMPISLAEGWEAVEEERRLLYVGVTRAREHLHLSWARARTLGARATRSPSRFLDGLFDGAPAVGTRSRREGAAGGGNRDGGRRSRPALPTVCRSCHRPLATSAERKIGRCDQCPATYDPELFEALRAWRSETAAAAKLPAYVVFTDATLVAIAESRPADLPALARIPGVGAVKLDRYGPLVLEVLSRG